MTKDTTIVTLENQYHKINIEVPETDLDAGDFVNQLLRPLMLAAGYSESTVNDYIPYGFG
jgi:hypothetical protein